MKPSIPIIMMLFTSLAVGNVYGQNRNDFHIRIALSGFNDMTIHYEVNNDSLIVYGKIYDSKQERFVDQKKKVYNKFETEPLIEILESTNWDTIPREMIKSVIGGFHYSIKLRWEGELYDYSVNSAYSEKLDMLMNTCNAIIPRSKVRERYSIPDTDWWK